MREYLLTLTAAAMLVLAGCGGGAQLAGSGGGSVGLSAGGAQDVTAFRLRFGQFVVSITAAVPPWRGMHK